MWKHFAMQFFSNMSYGCSQHLKKDNSHLFWIKVDCLQEFGIYESSWCISAWQWCLREQMIGLGDRRMIIIYIYIYSPQQCAVEKGFIPRAISSHQVDRWEFLSQWHLHLFTFYVVLLPVCWAEEEFTMNIYSLLKGDTSSGVQSHQTKLVREARRCQHMSHGTMWRLGLPSLAVCLHGWRWHSELLQSRVI